MARRFGNLEDRISNIIDEQAMFDLAGVRNARTVARSIVKLLEGERRRKQRKEPEHE